MRDPARMGQGPAVAPWSACRTCAFRGPGWAAYLSLVFLLVPFVTPPGPAQTAWVDGLNAAALLAFAFTLGVARPALQAPFAWPALTIAVGSLLALTNAYSPQVALLALAQDLYLYLWLVMTVNLLADHDDLGRFRLVWAVTAIVVAATCALLTLANGSWSPASLLSGRGLRASGPFTNPNMFADYLVLSMFMLLSLQGRISGVLLTAGAGALTLGLLLTKSNGGMTALGAGITAMGLARVAGAPGPPAPRLALAVAALGVIGLLVWTQSEWHWADGVIERLGSETFAGRVARSSDRRGRIWSQLEQTVGEQPLGIGPANSAELAVAIGQRERPGSFRSKEAHSDYVAAWVERGWIGFAGILLAVLESLRRMFSAWRRAGAGDAGRRLAIAALLGGLVATTVHSVVIEKLHFRHFWLYLAMCVAVSNDTRE